MKFVAYVKTQFHTDIKCIRTDNAKEFCEGSFQQFCQAHGILHQRICPYTPQQNGIVERKHRHLLETARTLSFQSKLPLKFRGDCILYATYLINRMPLRSINHLTPYFKLYKIMPSLDHLRTFGCLCYISTVPVHRTKFDSRAFPGVFLEYSVQTKGYKVLDIATQKITISRDVVFHETHFPFHMSNSLDTNVYPT